MSKRKSQADESVSMPTVKKMKLDKSIQYTEIGSLASEIKRLKFLGIVTTITALRECNNSQIFVFDVQDKTGVIRCSAYDETAVKLAKIVKQNIMFHITGIKLKRANRMFNSVDNDYEIEIMDDAEVVEIVGSPELVPTFESKDIFTDFCDISEQPTDKAINVVGILKHIGNLELINLVKSNDQVYKRVLQLMDEYKNNIHVTLWGKVAQNWAYKKYDVLTFKSVGVNEFNGLFGIKVYASSIITKNDDYEKSEKLMEIVAEILENNKK